MIISRIESAFLRYLLTRGCEPGSKLPSLDEISSEIGISVGKLREQFEVARVLGLVEASPRRGIRCLPYNFVHTVRLGLMLSLALDPAGENAGGGAFRAYSTLRIHLETAFWDEAVVLLSDEDKRDLLQLVEQAKAKLTTERVQIPYPEHRAFHLAIYRRLNNPFVLGLLEAYWDAYEAVELNTYADYSYLQEVWSYHERIAQAILAGDYERGKTLLIQHMQLIDRMGLTHEFFGPQTAAQQRSAPHDEARADGPDIPVTLHQLQGEAV